jgi:lipopolysaccharide transport system permease protein
MVLLVYTFVFNTIFSPRDASVTDYGPYALFLATGVIPWIWVQTAWLEGTNALLANAGLIRKASFPAELLPLISVFASLVHLLLALPVVIAGFVMTGWLGQKTSLGPLALLLPVVVLLQIPLVAGLTLATAALNVHFKDIKDILNNLITLLFFLTPILYSIETLKPFPWLYRIVAANPFTPFLRAYQDLIFFGRMPSALSWFAMVGIGLLFWSLGAWLFDRLAETLVEAV